MRRLALVVLASLLAAGCGAPDRTGGSASADRFLERFVTEDGRVVRHDQGGDTVSEGQAYAMLIAVATDDEQRFDRVWRWTREHLQRDDGLLSWRFANGEVADDEPASDADIDAADALRRAAGRWGRPELAREAERITDAVVAKETVRTPRGPLLVAGPWAREDGWVNPGYVAPAPLYQAGHPDLAQRSLAAVEELIGGAHRLPPDWARLREDGRIVPSLPPSGEGEHARYGYDAVRLPLRLAASCDGQSRELAARLWRTLQDIEPGALPRSLDGATHGGPTAPGLAAAAAAARAAREDERAEELLDQADELEDEHPTYFGSALVALARTAWKPDCSD